MADPIASSFVEQGISPERISDTDFTPEQRLEALRLAADMLAKSEVADCVATVLKEFDGSLSDFQKASGLDKAYLSKLARGQVNKKGCTVGTLALIALAMDKTLTISID